MEKDLDLCSIVHQPDRKYIVIKLSEKSNGLKGFNVDMMCVHVPYVASDN